MEDFYKKWQDFWSKENLYKWDSKTTREQVFSIDTPPPTVSGSLHMGHVYSYTQTDFVARYQRMTGKNVFYPIGFDDNGLPTERLVEKIKKIKAKDFSREEFINICHEVISEEEEKYKDLFKSLGISFDWGLQYQTISQESQKLSQLSFVDLYNKGKVYRKFGPSFWDAKDQTAIAQAENVDVEHEGIFNDIKFKTTEGSEIVIATTRPELLCACVAVFYHPDDLRYNKLKGKQAVIPIYDHEVPILEDDEVEIEKGTGLVMCCTFGDIQDIAWVNKHKLPVKTCINKYHKMENAGFLDDMKVKDARELIIEKLKESRLLIKQEHVTQKIKCAERSGGILEIIPTYQWFVDVLNHKEDFHKINSQCNWRPAFMSKRLENWIDGLNQDWCVSRQRYFGVPFPVWYSKRKGEEGRVLLPDLDQLPVNPLVDLPKGYTKEEVEPESDVMDTWATSAISPQLSSHYIADNLGASKEKHEKIFPFDLRPQAHEIIRIWAFYTIVKSFFHQQSLPWHNLMISGWCLAEDKSKMSKSKGKTITPEALLDQYGPDAIRYWASTSKLGMDVVYSPETFKIAKRLINKLSNAGKFIRMHLNDNAIEMISAKRAVREGKVSASLDIWLLSKLSKVVQKATDAFDKYEYYDARSCAENFFWEDFCDNYLELAKKRAYDQNNLDPKGKISAITTLVLVFENVLRLLSPFIPHVCDEVHEQTFGAQHSLTQRGSWPNLEEQYYDEKIHHLGNVLKAYFGLVHKHKSLKGIALNKEINEINYSGEEMKDLEMLSDFKNAVNAKVINYSSSIEEDDDIVISPCGKYKIYVR